MGTDVFNDFECFDKFSVELFSMHLQLIHFFSNYDIAINICVMPDRKLNTKYTCTLKIKHEQSRTFTFKKWYEYKSEINIF